MACKIDPQKKDTQEKIKWKNIEIIATYQDVLGGTLTGGYAIKNNIAALREQKADLEDELALARATKKLSKVASIRQEKEDIDEAIKDLSFVLEDLPDKAKVLQKIEKIFTGHVMELQSQMLYTADPKVIFNMLKEYVTMSYKNFKTFADLDLATLASMHHKLDRFFKKIRARSAKEGKLTHVQNTILDPSAVTFHTDPSGQGYEVIRQLKELDDNVYADGRVYKETIDKAFDAVETLIKERQFMFTHLPVHLNKITNRDEKEAAKKVVEFVHEVLDGQTIYAIPIPIIVKNKFGKLTFTGEFAEDRKEYYSILNNNIFNGINDGGQIQKMNIKGQDYYFILIKKVDAKGKEYHRLYEVPYNEDHQNIEKSPSGKKASLEFYSQWNKRGEDSLAGDVYYDQAGNSVRRQGALSEGWLKATRYKPLTGTITKGKKKGQSFKTSSYLGYQSIDLPEVIPEMWNFIRVARDTLKQFRQYLIEEIRQNEAHMYNVLKEVLPDLKEADKATLNELLLKKFGVDVDTLDMNVVVKGSHVYTANHIFGELINYVPWMFREEDTLSGYFRAKESMQKKIINDTKQLDAYKGQVQDGDNTINHKIIQLRNEIKEDNVVLASYENSINTFLGLEDPDTSLNQSTLIKASKHRSGIMHPFPIVTNIKINDENFTRISHSGRRKDYSVFHRYIDQSLRSIHQNKVKTSFTNMLGKTTLPTIHYVMDHMKSAFGRKDVEAGFLGFDYSDKRLTDALSKVTGYQVSINDSYRMGKLFSQAISSNLLSGIFTSISNNTQRVNGIIKTEAEFVFKAWNLRRTDPDRAKSIGDNAGVTDAVIAIGDVLIGTSTASDKWYTGLKEKTTVALLTLSKMNFLKKARKNSVWKAVAEKLAENADPTEMTLYEARELALEGIWEISNGLAGNSLTMAQRKALPKKFNKILVEHSVGRLVEWALNGGVLRQVSKGLSFFKFAPGEINMRQELAIVAAYQAQADKLIPADYEGDELFNHPEAKRYARILVNQTMFGMTNAHLSKMMKGATGTLLFKFKPYQMKQFMTEWQEMSNWYHSLRDKNISTKDILNDFVSLKPRYHTNKTFRKLLAWRGIWTVIANLTFYAPIFSTLNGFVGRRLGYKTNNAMQRGLESQIISTVMKTLMTGAALAGMFGSDEEERIYQDSFRYFMPMYFNVIWDTIHEGDPFRVVQLYSKGTYDLLNELTD